VELHLHFGLKGKQSKERTNLAARTISPHRGDRRSIGSDAPQLMSDEGLVAVAKMGDRTAFDELHKRHAAKVFSGCSSDHSTS